MSETNNQLQWKCRRGMLELDIILGRFLAEFYPILNSDEQQQFESLLEETDPDIYAWLMSYQADSAQHHAILEKIRHAVVRHHTL